MKKIVLLLFLVFISGCGRLKLALDLPNSFNEVVTTQTETQFLTLSAEQIDEAVQLSWNDIGSGEYSVYRAWSYPDKDSSYQLVERTSETTITVNGAYWSGRHYYIVKSKNIKSDYILYCPR